jgi:uncharacterized protein YggE
MNPDDVPAITSQSFFTVACSGEQGEATVKRAPDLAWFSISTETRDAKANNARRMSAESMTAIQATLRATGLSAYAIRTTGYGFSPDVEWKNGRQIVKGYIVSNQIEIRIDDLRADWR